MATSTRSSRRSSQQVDPIMALRIWLNTQKKLESNMVYNNVNKLYKRFNNEDEFVSYFFERTEWDAIATEPLEWNYDFIRFVMKVVVDKTGLRNEIIKTFLSDKTNMMLHVFGICRVVKANSVHYRILTGYTTSY